MTEAKRDGNQVPTLIAVSSSDGTTPVLLYADPVTHRLLTSLSGVSGGRAFFAEFDSGTSCSVHTGVVGVAIPAAFDGLNLTAVLGTVHTKGITGTMTAQVRRRRAGSNVNMLSAAWSIGDAFFSTTATIDTSNDDLATGDTLYIDVATVHSGTAALGLSMTLSFG